MNSNAPSHCAMSLAFFECALKNTPPLTTVRQFFKTEPWAPSLRISLHNVRGGQALHRPGCMHIILVDFGKDIHHPVGVGLGLLRAPLEAQLQKHGRDRSTNLTHASRSPCSFFRRTHTTIAGPKPLLSTRFFISSGTRKHTFRFSSV